MHRAYSRCVQRNALDQSELKKILICVCYCPMTLASTCDQMRTCVFRDDLIRRLVSTCVPSAQIFLPNIKRTNFIAREEK